MAHCNNNGRLGTRQSPGSRRKCDGWNLQSTDGSRKMVGMEREVLSMDKVMATQLISEIVEILEEAETPKELWPVAFEHLWPALNMGAQGESAPEAGQPESSVSQGPYGELAKRVGVESSHLADLYAAEEDGTLVARPPARNLSASKTSGTIELALLACAGREASGLQDTPSAVIRDLCSLYGKFDSNNFASTMLSGDDYWQISGKAQQRTYRLRMPGWDRAGEVIRRVLAVE